MKELIFAEEGKLQFGDYRLQEKAKQEDFAFGGDLYKVKTFYEITKLERNGLLAYESVPGSTVRDFEQDGQGLRFRAESLGSVQLSLGLEEDREYEVFADEKPLGLMKTNRSGKLVLSLEFEEGKPIALRFMKR
ncbi:endosialidase [Bacteroides heparinolyticus]|uniref:endosialidase n=1 Tax=Prevotella heparinolytica TaxID=28113 RepID=UPI0035A06321